jgi:pimeloyl-ACP methyl ester carboxylesterase
MIVGISSNALQQKPRAVEPDAKVAVVAGADEFTIELHAGRAEVRPGRPARFDCLIETDEATFAAVRAGAPGVEAFLGGKLAVHKNLALALQLDAVLDGPARGRRGFKAMHVEAAGVDTFYMEAGRGPAVILLHGLGATNASFLPTFWELSRDHRVVAPDLPGHGDSGKPIRAYHAGFYARWVSEFMDALGLRRAVLIGNSMGGRIAIEVGLRHPRRVSRLVCLAPAAAFLRYRQWAPIVRLLRPELALLPIVLPKQPVVDLTRSLFWKPDRLPASWHEGAAEEFLRIFNTPRGRIAFFSALREVYLDEPYGKHGFWERLHSLRPPALFVWGDHDRLVPAAFARHVTRELPNARSVVLRSCGHVPQFEQPERTHRLIREFLAPASSAAA